MTRKEAETAAVRAGAQTSKSVTRNTDVLVAGPTGGGNKHSDATGSASKADLWTEDQFLAAVNNAAAAGVNGGASGGVSGGVGTTGDGGGASGGGSSGGSDNKNSAIPLRIMLAQSWVEGKTDLTGGQWLLSEKLDGMRAWCKEYAHTQPPLNEIDPSI